MKFERGREYILWDGDCAFCRRGVETLKTFDAARAFIFAPHQAYSDEELRRVGLSRRRCEREIQAVARSGRTFGGAFALNYFFWKQPRWNFLVALSLFCPPIFLVEVLCYRAVAQNRVPFSKMLFSEIGPSQK